MLRCTLEIVADLAALRRGSVHDEPDQLGGARFTTRFPTLQLVPDVALERPSDLVGGTHDGDAVRGLQPGPPHPLHGPSGRVPGPSPSDRWTTAEPAALLTAMVDHLKEQAEVVYSSREAREAFQARRDTLVDDPGHRRVAIAAMAPVASLFAPTNLAGNRRIPLGELRPHHPPGFPHRRAAEAAAATIRLVATRSGPAAADRRLLAELAGSVPPSAAHIVIASGEAVFAEPARRLAAAGRRLLVVAPAGGMARELAAAAESTVVLTAACRPAAGELPARGRPPLRWQKRPPPRTPASASRAPAAIGGEEETSR